MPTEALTEKATFNVVQKLDTDAGIEIVEAQYRTHCFARHVHEGYTIGVVDIGAQRFYRTGAQHIAGQNSIILVNADDVHTGEAETEGGWAYRAMYPLAAHFEHVCADVFANDTGIPYFPNAVIEDAQLAAQLRLFFELAKTETNRLLVETVLYAFMSGLVLRHSRRRKTPQTLETGKQQLLRVRDYLLAHLEENPSLEYLASIAGLSPFHLVRQFKKAFGLPPHAFQIQARIKRAKTLLRQGQSAATVAAVCGFHDQSHLTHHFKRTQGITPARYQSGLSKPLQY